MRQIENLRKFKTTYPTIDDVVKCFDVSKAGQYAVAWDILLQMPEACLCDIDAIYNNDLLVLSLAKLWLLYIYDKTGSRAEYTDEDVERDATDFCTRYGNYCTIEMMCAYFASYLEDYADTIAAYYSYADVSKNFRKKFLPQWNEARCRMQDQQTQEERKSDGLTGKRALMKLFYDFVDGRRDGLTVPPPTNEEEAAKWDPDDFHQILLWQYLSPEEQQEIENYARNKNKPF